jgi:hypothetical protein
VSPLAGDRGEEGDKREYEGDRLVGGAGRAANLPSFAFVWVSESPA